MTAITNTLKEKFARYGLKLNSYDLLKTIAIILMVADYYGKFIALDNNYLRLLGRLSFPIFFFLIGYSGKNIIKYDIAALAVLLLIFSLIIKYPPLPLNILFTVIACRLAMALAETKGYLKNNRTLMEMFLILFIFIPPSIAIFDYGTVSLMFAILGLLVRKRPGDWKNLIFFAITGVTYLFYQKIIFAFNALVAFALGIFI